MSETYTTVQGDMWDAIAYKALGSTAYTDALMAANKSKLGYYSFPSGIVLRLPEVPENTAENSALPPWKKAAG